MVFCSNAVSCNKLFVHELRNSSDILEIYKYVLIIYTVYNTDCVCKNKAIYYVIINILFC